MVSALDQGVPGARPVATVRQRLLGEAALAALDRDGSRLLEYDEFLGWWLSEGRVRAVVERGGPQAPAAGRRRVFEAERTCKLALAHEGKATCDVKIHLTLDTAGADGAAAAEGARATAGGARG